MTAVRASGRRRVRPPHVRGQVRLPLLALAALATLVLTGCAGGSAQHSEPSGTGRHTASAHVSATPDPTATARTDQKDTGVDPAAQAYVHAVADENLDALVDAFLPDAQLIDVGRRFHGHDEIRRWARNEVIGGKLTVLKNTPKANGTTLLVRFAPGNTGGFEAHYEFTVRDGRIAELNLQYA